MKCKSLKPLAILLLTLLLFHQSSYGQQHKDNTWNHLKTDAYYMGDGFLHVLKSPARWKGKDFLKVAGFLGGAFLISFLDEPFNDWALDNNNPRRRENLEKFADITGKPGPAIVGFSAIYGTGLLLNNETIRDAGVVIFGSLASTALMQTISKAATGRARPASGLRYDVFKPFSNDPAFHSFPSGHAVSSMTITAALARQINFKPARIFLYGIGIATGFARSFNQAHWLSDVVVSMGLTYLAVHTVEKRYQEKKAAANGLPPPSSKTRVNFIPYATGFKMTVTFP
ncbi:phosphatase PAP2 family protein [Fulvivirgaceae bacterium BMA12]|uniref:Phosphatase PAP2 family protein n=1 Tax=Agaribacillus aureus TaxID=3051825 RepID=A0ABT8L3R4_9BACT|nr:phosphatase PAP2 family protein [Fulvivirgaceae bacterium BMA12]